MTQEVIDAFYKKVAELNQLNRRRRLYENVRDYLTCLIFVGIPISIGIYIGIWLITEV